MKKYLRTLALFLALTLISQIFVISSVAESGNCGSGVTYSLDTDTGEFILSGTGATDNYDKFDDEGWTGIWNPGNVSKVKYVPWKDDVDLIKSITIEDGVAKIGKNAFSQCHNVEKITFLSSDVEIASTAFYLHGNYVIYLFHGSTADSYFSSSKYTKVYLKEYTVLYNANGGEGAPETQTKKENIDLILSETVPTREGYTFMGWATSADGQAVYAPSDVLTENSDVTLYAVWDKQVGDDDEPVFTISPESDFKYEVNGTTVTITDYLGEGGNIIIPSTIAGYGVMGIGDFAFSSKSGLTGVIVPDSVTFIGNGAFDHCGELRCIEIPEGVRSIGSEAFAFCYGLESITLPEKLKSIEISTFYCCNALRSLTVPAGVKNIASNAISMCSSLESITFETKDAVFAEDIINECENLGTVYLYKNSTADEYFSAGDYVKVYFDVEDNEVEVDYEDGVFEGDVSMVWVTLDDETLGNFAISKENGEKPHMVGYDISFELDGVETQPDGLVTIKIKVPGNFNSKKCKVYHVSEDGTATDMEAEYIDGYMVFETDHFGYYVIADMSVSKPGDTNSDGELDVKDVVLLAQFVAQWSVTIDKHAADCNADDAINIMDAVLLAQFLANWYVTLG